MRSNESEGNLFRIDVESKQAESVAQKKLREMDMKEEDDFQEWVINIRQY
jgi:hypothetical protein